MRPGRRHGGRMILLAAIVLLGACSGSSDTPKKGAIYRRVTTPTIRPGDPVPVPEGPVVLTIDGDVGNPNVGDELRFDLATLERLGLIEYTVDDYQALGHHVVMRGPLLASILAVAGAPKDARRIRTAALNDYKATIPLSDVARFPVMVATTADGRRMGIERYGPVRVVYPNLSHSFDKAIYDPRWIWQLSRITVG